MGDMGKDGARSVIVLSSHVARGSVGNRAAVFALETLGFPVWAVPTVILPWHPGHGPATRIVPDTKQFCAFLEDLERAPWLGEVGAILSGYLGSAEQAKAIASLVERLRSINPNATYVCDPVIGDAGGLYVPAEIAAAIRDLLVPRADIVTPNRYELEWLVDRPLPELTDLIEAASLLGTRMTLVTSASGFAAGRTGSLLVTGKTVLLAEHSVIERPPNGPGDLTAALLLARLMQGLEPAKALQSTTAAVFEVLARAKKRGADELMLETDTESLSRPMAIVNLRHLANPQPKRSA